MSALTQQYPEPHTEQTYYSLLNQAVKVCQIEMLQTRRRECQRMHLGIESPVILHWYIDSYIHIDEQ